LELLLEDFPFRSIYNHSGWTQSDRARADLPRSYTPKDFTPDCTNLDKSTLV